MVGSSKNKTVGLLIKAEAKSKRRRIPPEYVLTIRLPASVKLNLARSSSAFSIASFFGRRKSLPTIIKFSRPVRFSSTAAYCPERPIISLACAGFLKISTPATCAVPESGFNRVDKILTVVVLPAPFGPSKPKIVPVGTTRSTPAKA